MLIKRCIKNTSFRKERIVTTSAYRRRRLAGLTALLLVAAAYGPSWANAAGAEDVLAAAKCSGCHRLTPPAPEQRTVARLV